MDTSPPIDADALWNATFDQEDDLHAFEVALNAEETAELSGVPGSPMLPGSSSPRIRKISALSDFAPVNLKVKRRKRKDKHAAHKRLGHDWLFILVRWPLLLFIFLFIGAEFSIYVMLRQLVNAKEWVTAWRGQKGKLRKTMRASKDYEEWKTAATELDHYMQFDQWKHVDEDPYYDWRLIKKVGRSLKMLREKGDARGCLGVLETCIRSNFAGIESSRLYSETYYGTKDLLEEYLAEQERALEYVRETPDLSLEEKKRFFKNANANYGISALCLSGGAGLGYYHYGVVRALLDAGTLPRVVTGTSAGGLIAALTACYTNEELKHILVPEIAERLTACDEPFSVWFKRFWQTGARFDSVIWARKSLWFTRGSTTFREAYLRTGKILNITVIPADRHSPSKVLNYVTAPNTIIWSTLLASAAVPGVMNPVVLMEKQKDGPAIPWNWGSRWKDGSLRVDIPLQALNLYFNVTYPVVSQVNPHVHLFFFAPRGSPGRPVARYKGKGWRGNFLLSAGEQWLKHELTKNFKVIRDLELLPEIVGQDWSSVFLQRFEGAITIWPKTRFMDWLAILEDPTVEEMDRKMKVSQLVTWPKIHMVNNRLRIETQIYRGRQSVRESMRTKKRLSVSESPNGMKSSPPPVSGSDLPLSVDTDAEAAFANGTQWFYHRGHDQQKHKQQQPQSSPRLLGQDPLKSSSVRRKWVADLLQHDGHARETRYARPVINTGIYRRPRTHSVPNMYPGGSQADEVPRSSGLFSSQVARESSGSSDSSESIDDMEDHSQTQASVLPTIEGVRSDGDEDSDV
ncbi:patatin-domain-containing protein [Cylindrobasidium torrendii FP15055 ss-10]|uniref:Patatin-like phospholipase domain-containing protein n=1 Tax=Cylindrobasidium torrendii FP15055 ss-10 TaxID=1314674 RepID=A0A0D7BMN7_9AGAR|nr:patatin-domain-containing protein [Cylindrobasidium torrendii FP15055 ss-10]